MSDARETLRRGIGGFAPRPDGYERVLRRRDRRRRNQRAMAAALAGAIVLIGVLAFVAALRSTPRPGGDGVTPAPPETPTNPRPAFQRTATIGGLTVTSPSDWVLVDYWGLWDADATSLDGTSVPLLELTNFDPGLSTPVCDVGPGEPTRLRADGVAILVMVGNDGTDVAERCGGNVEDSTAGMISVWGNTVPYHIVLAAGPEVSEADRVAAEEILRSIAWTAAGTPYARGQSPRYVLDGWQEGSAWGLLEALPSEQNVELSVWESDGNGSSGSSGHADYGVPSPNALEGDFFGAVTEDAARVEFHFARGWTPLEARVIDLPPSLPFAFDAYWFGSEPKDSTSGEVVAIGGDGAILGSNLPPLVNTVQVATVRAFGTTWNVKDSSAADGYFDVACVEPAEAPSSDPCERPLGDGPNIQTFNEPVPAVFVSVFAGVDGVDIQTDDGTVFHALMFGNVVAVFALEGGGSGRLIYHFDGDKVHEGPRVEWRDLGQAIGDGSFPPPDTT